MSAEGKNKVALAQEARWAKVRKAVNKAAKKEANTEPATPVKAVKTAVKATKVTPPSKGSKKAAAVRS
jgi:hypothetical protein